MTEKLLSINEAAEFLHLSVKDLEELVNEGRIPAFHLDGKYLRFRKEDLATFTASLSIRKEEAVEHYTFRDGLHDFFYFNDFYLLSIFLILLILFAILRM